MCCHHLRACIRLGFTDEGVGVGWGFGLDKKFPPDILGDPNIVFCCWFGCAPNKDPPVALLLLWSHEGCAYPAILFSHEGLAPELLFGRAGKGLFNPAFPLLPAYFPVIFWVAWPNIEFEELWVGNGLFDCWPMFPKVLACPLPPAKLMALGLKDGAWEGALPWTGFWLPKNLLFPPKVVWVWFPPKIIGCCWGWTGCIGTWRGLFLSEASSCFEGGVWNRKAFSGFFSAYFEIYFCFWLSASVGLEALFDSDLFWNKGLRGLIDGMMLAWCFVSSLAPFESIFASDLLLMRDCVTSDFFVPSSATFSSVLGWAKGWEGWFDFPPKREAPPPNKFVVGFSSFFLFSTSLFFSPVVFPEKSVPKLRGFYAGFFPSFSFSVFFSYYFGFSSFPFSPNKFPPVTLKTEPEGFF